jgi:ubiquitin carboxyl-terminal hydrolase L5
MSFLTYIRKPVYGLIFLFRYREDDSGEKQEICPSHVWFANQIANNSCATAALLNMVCNIPSIELGPEIASFKAETQSLTPAQRGERVSYFEHVRRIHNSFARYAICYCPTPPLR